MVPKSSASLAVTYHSVHAPDQPTLSARRDAALDGLRGVAVLLVFLFHYGGGLQSHHAAVRALGYLTQAGWIGVNFFFALSGFLITRLWVGRLGQPGGLRTFYRRRALRILPLYYAALLTCGITALLAGASVPRLKPLLAFVFFLQNVPGFLHTASQTPPPLPVYHLWSLAVEEQFYLLWPLFLIGLRSRQRGFRFCLWIFAASCLFRSALVLLPLPPYPALLQALGVLLPSRAGALALGGALALRCPGVCLTGVEQEPSQSHRKRMQFFCLAGTAGLLLFVFAGLRSGRLLLGTPLMLTAGLTGADILSAALVGLTVCAQPLRGLLGSAGLPVLGRISYGFYVLHILLQPVFDTLAGWGTGASSGALYQSIRLLVAFPLSLCGAWLSYRFFESRFLRLGSQHRPHRARVQAL